MRGLEIKVALYRQSEFAAQRFQFRQIDAAKLGALHPQIAKPEGDSGVFGLDLGQKPCAGSVRREQLENREKVDFLWRSAYRVLLPAIGQKRVAKFFGEKFHGEALLFRSLQKRLCGGGAFQSVIRCFLGVAAGANHKLVVAAKAGKPPFNVLRVIGAGLGFKP